MHIQNNNKYIILLLCIVPFVFAGMAPSDLKRNKRRKSYFTPELIKKFTKIYQGSHKSLARDMAKQHTSSDAMELYSVAAKKVLRVEEKENVPLYAPEYDLVVTNKKGFKQNKFVTETISFQNLRIKSQDNNQYLCVKNEEVHFMTSFRNKKTNKPRKRCQFTWDFTNQMHIQLSTVSKGVKLYLTVKNNRVTLTQRHESSELERSFIWVPTMSAGTDGKNTVTNNKNKRHLSSSSPAGRSFDGASHDDSNDIRVCSDLLTTLFKKSNRISNLKDEISALKKELKKATTKL